MSFKTRVMQYLGFSPIVVATPSKELLPPIQKQEINSVGVIHLSKEEDFETLLHTHEKVMVDFTATWCGPCQKMKPQFLDLANRFHNVAFVAVDVDDFETLAAKYKIRAMPTFVAIYRQQEHTRIMGANVNELQKMVLELENSL